MQNKFNTLINGLKLLIDAKLKDSKSDWNQNDKNASNYINNKTHYDSRKMVTNGVNIVVDNIEDKEKVIIRSECEDDKVVFEYGYVKISENPLTLEELKLCEYRWIEIDNGLKYYDDYWRCDKKFFHVEKNLIGVKDDLLSVFEETEINIDEDNVIILSKGIWVAYELGVSYISWLSNIRGYEYLTGELKQLDKKYISHLTWKDIAHHINGKVLEEFTLEFNNDNRHDNSLPNSTWLIENKIYTVIFDGVEYKCLSYRQNDAICIGNQLIAYNVDDWIFDKKIKSDEPFFIATCKPNEWNCIFVSQYGNHSFSISDEVYDRIDEKYIPMSLINTLDSMHSELEQNTMNKTNPSGIGKFSMNRLSDSNEGDNSSTLGYNCSALGSNSNAIGLETVANSINQNVIGKFNIADKFPYDINEDRSAWIKYGYYFVSSEYEFDYETGLFYLINPINTRIISSNYTDYYICSSNPSNEIFKLTKTYIAGTYQQRGAIRMYAMEVNGEYAHIVGNGADNETRSNAHTLDWEGNAWYAGDVYVGSTSGTNKDDGSEKLAKMSDLPACIDKTLVLNTRTATIPEWDTDLNIKPNTEYLVIFNGVEYYVTTDNLGNTDKIDERPFYLASTADGDALCPTNIGEEFTYAIYEVKGFRQIDERLIPDTITRTDNIVLISPNGTKYKLIVADDGTLSTTTV